jgi:hypothetical protein
MLRVSVVSAQLQGRVRGGGALALWQTGVPRVSGACGRVRAGGRAAGRAAGASATRAGVPGAQREVPQRPHRCHGSRCQAFSAVRAISMP